MARQCDRCVSIVVVVVVVVVVVAQGRWYGKYLHLTTR